MAKQSQSARKAAARRRVAVIGAVLVTFALAFVGLLVAGPAFAEDRSDAVRDRDESESRISSLQDEMDGISEDLAELYVAVEQSKIEIIDLQSELAAAETRLADAERKHAQLIDQLADAEALKAEIQSSIETANAQEVELQTAVGNMAREMYRGEAVSPLQVVVSMDDLGEISSRAAAASALSRVQSKALDDVRTGLVVSENQAEKQRAVTERITQLEAEAEQAAVEAELARDDVASSLKQVETKLAEQKSLQAEWEQRKAEAESELSAAETDRNDAVARIAEMDRKAAEEAASRAATANQAPSGSSSSGGTTSSGGSGMFANPFDFTASVTSYFGWRLHPIFGYYRLHDGTDFGAACGTTQYATRSGTVASTGYDAGAGNYVTINHGVIGGNSYITSHYHLSSILVSPGQSVSTDTPIGITGTTGSSTGCHLHLILYLNGTPVSILPYM